MADQETVADVLADIRTKKVIGYPNAWLPRLEAAHTRELEALRADALRYRFFREALLDDETNMLAPLDNLPTPTGPAEFDAGIDAAIAAREPNRD